MIKANIRFDNTRKKWLVDFRLPKGAEGKQNPRIRRWRDTEEEAKSEARSLEERYLDYGRSGASIDPKKWQRFQVLEARLRGIGSLEDAVNFYLNSVGGNNARISVKEAWKLFISDKEKQGISNGWKTALTGFSRRMEPLGNESVCDITTQRLARLIDSYSKNPESRRNLLRGISNYLGWCKKQGWVQQNVAESIPKPRVIRDTPGTFTVKQVEMILRKMEQEAPYLIPWNAIRFFAGVRSASAGCIRLDDIHLENKAITIRPETNKTRGRRDYLENCGENLWAWLNAYLPALNFKRIGDSNRIWSNYFVNETGTLIRDLGIDAPKNAHRHTFATMHLALHNDPGRTAIQMGHKDSPRVLWTHYRGLATSEEAAAYFQILPE